MSGRTRQPLHTIFGAAGDEFGIAVSGAGDVDDDGFADLIVGAQRDDDNGMDAGRAFVEDAGFTGLPTRERIYGAGCPGGAGMPRIDHWGRARLGTTMTIRLRGALPTVPAVVLIGNPVPTSLAQFGMTGCNGYVHLNGLSGWSYTNADGLAGFPLHLPPAPNFLVGLRLDMQWATLDLAANPGGLVASNALAARFR